MKVHLAAMLAAGLLAVVAVSGCSTPTPTPTTAPQATAASSPSASPLVTATPAATATPSASPSAAAAQPDVVCQPYNWVDADPSHLPAITLTCENGVAAAKVVVGPDLAVVSIEFGWGRWCPPGAACIPFVPNDGWVIFHRSHDLPDLLVSVTTDASGKVTAAAPTPLPAPSPS